MRGEDKRVETLRSQLSKAKIRIGELEAKNRRHEHRIKALSDSEEKYRTVAEGAGDALIMVDNKGIIFYWNTAAERLFGFRHGEAVGKDLRMIIPERYHAHYVKGLNAFRETGRGSAIGKTVDSEAVNKNGMEFPVEMSLSAIQVRRRWHAVGLVRDITDRRRIEERMRDDIQKYMIMLQNGREALMLIDFETLKILEVNQAAADLYGYSREELLERRALDLVSDTQITDAVAKEWTSQSTGGINILMHSKSDRTLFPVAVSACSFMWKGRKTYCASMRDVSGRSHATEGDGEYIKKMSMFG